MTRMVGLVMAFYTGAIAVALGAVATRAFFFETIGVSEDQWAQRVAPIAEEILKLAGTSALLLLAIGIGRLWPAIPKLRTVLPVPLIGAMVGAGFSIVETWARPEFAPVRLVTSLPLHMAAAAIASMLFWQRASVLVRACALPLAVALHLWHNNEGPLLSFAIFLAAVLVLCLWTIRRRKKFARTNGA